MPWEHHFISSSPFWIVPLGVYSFQVADTRTLHGSALCRTLSIPSDDRMLPLVAPFFLVFDTDRMACDSLGRILRKSFYYFFFISVTFSFR